MWLLNAKKYQRKSLLDIYLGYIIIKYLSYNKLCMLSTCNIIFRSRLRVFDVENLSLCGRGSIPFNPSRLVFPRCTKPTKPLALLRQANGFSLVIWTRYVCEYVSVKTHDHALRHWRISLNRTSERSFSGLVLGWRDVPHVFMPCSLIPTIRAVR